MVIPLYWVKPFKRGFHTVHYSCFFCTPDGKTVLERFLSGTVYLDISMKVELPQTLNFPRYWKLPVMEHSDRKFRMYLLIEKGRFLAPGTGV